MKSQTRLARGFLAMVGVGLLSACSRDPAPATVAPDRPRVTVETLRLRDWEDRVVVPVTVAPAATVHVVARVPGRVREVRVQEGDEVRAGDPLVVLDTRDLALAVRQAEGQVALARASLRAAEAQRDTLVRDRARFEELAKTGSASQGEADRMRAQAEAAEAQVGVARAQVQVAEAALALARKALDDARVTAPVDGLVMKRGVDPGQETSPAAATPLVVLASVDPVHVDGSVPEHVFGRLRAGMEASVRFDGLPGETFRGTVTLVGPAVDPVSRLVRVRVVVRNPADQGRRRLAAGMSGVLEVVPETGRYFVVPMNAVRRQEEDRLVVFVVGDDGRVAERAVRPVRKEGLTFLALEGLAEGERLVTAGPKELHAGDEVEVVSQ